MLDALSAGRHLRALDGASYFLTSGFLCLRDLSSASNLPDIHTAIRLNQGIAHSLLGWPVLATRPEYPSQPAPPPSAATSRRGRR